MSRLVFRNGRWYRGKAAPEHLEEDLRRLPSTYVTKETGDDSKIHQLDDPHIRRALTREQMIAETTEVKTEPIKTLRRAPAGEIVPLRQDFIDVEKVFIMKGIVDGQIREVMQYQRMYPDLEVANHIWFPEENVNNWVVRPGWAPPDSERPKHLRGFELNIDLLNIPQRVRDALARQGMDAGYFLKRILSPRKPSNLIEVG